MAKFYDVVGFATSVETPTDSGIWVDVITEYPYFGDVIRNSRKLDNNGDKLNDDISVGNSISIVGDQQAVEHFSKIKYVHWAGENFTVDDVTVESPRLILRLGRVYNGPTPAAP